MKLHEFLKSYCMLIDNIITIVGNKEKIVQSFEVTNLSSSKTGVYDNDNFKYIKIPDDILNAEIITWGVYSSNNRSMIKIHIRYEVK